MRKIALSLLFCSILLFVNAQQKTYFDVPYMQLTGTSEMEVTPDIINISVTIYEKNFNGAKSIDLQESMMKDSLRKLGVDVSKNVTVINLRNNTKFRKTKDDKVIMVREYNILLNNAKSTMQFMDMMEQIGIGSVSIKSYDHSKMVELRKQVRIDAIKAAKEKADYLTAAIGQTVGKAINIEEIDTNTNNNIRYNQSMKTNTFSSLQYGYNDSLEGVEEDINFAMITIKFSVKVVFLLN